MKPFYLAEWGKEIGKSVDAIIADGKYPILLYRGMSGTATATTVSQNISHAHTEFAMMYVRKKSEKSHGCRIEYSSISAGNREIVWIICDDFISTGKTVLETLKTVSKYFDIEIPFESVRYALSLDANFANIANTVNTLERAVSIRSNSNKAVCRIKRNYKAFILKQRKERIIRKEKQEQANRDFLDSLTKW